jgi:hypothetical protein
MAKIFTARLLSGEHIIGELVEETSSGISLSKALLIGVVADENGKPTIGLSPVSHFAPRNEKGNECVIPHSAILAVIGLDNDIVNIYKQSVGSIITPSFILP